MDGLSNVLSAGGVCVEEEAPFGSFLRWPLLYVKSADTNRNRVNAFVKAFTGMHVRVSTNLYKRKKKVHTRTFTLTRTYTSTHRNINA